MRTRRAPSTVTRRIVRSNATRTGAAPPSLNLTAQLADCDRDVSLMLDIDGGDLHHDDDDDDHEALAERPTAAARQPVLHDMTGDLANLSAIVPKEHRPETELRAEDEEDEGEEEDVRDPFDGEEEGLPCA
jgi:hypothetical protein